MICCLISSFTLFILMIIITIMVSLFYFAFLLRHSSYWDWENVDWYFGGSGIIDAKINNGAAVEAMSMPVDVSFGFDGGVSQPIYYRLRKIFSFLSHIRFSLDFKHEYSPSNSSLFANMQSVGSRSRPDSTFYSILYNFIRSVVLTVCCRKSAYHVTIDT